MSIKRRMKRIAAGAVTTALAILVVAGIAVGQKGAFDASRHEEADARDVTQRMSLRSGDNVVYRFVSGSELVLKLRAGKAGEAKQYSWVIQDSSGKQRSATERTKLTCWECDCTSGGCGDPTAHGPCVRVPCPDETGGFLLPITIQ